jgi:hypothetical protein
MSHFTRVKTQLRNLDTVRRALEDLGYEVRKGEVRGYGTNVDWADLVVSISTTRDIGFRVAGQSIEMVADLWGEAVTAQEIRQKVAQRYAYLTILEQTEAQGWQRVTEEVQDDGSIRLVMQRWE